MTSRAQKAAIRQNSQERRHQSAFRNEFYAGNTAKNKKHIGNSAANGRARSRRGKLPAWAYVATGGIVLCIVVVIGSSAMIFLHKLAAMFGIYLG
ncbi:MAG: hypothetical protein CMM52_13000 [Rhodospirillaceae bacterium]|nr:hypothetical protein [Rhodospirillaceae bacterium]|tara:strand:- start:50443 stop:50727 length:285 start_codon:yes stop_codon:yes gene_type:complete